MPDDVVAVERDERETIRAVLSKRVDDLRFVWLAKSLRGDAPYRGLAARSLFSNLDHAL